jgi:hypothetical protein
MNYRCKTGRLENQPVQKTAEACTFSFAGAGIELGITISVLAIVLSGTQKGQESS